MIFSVVVHASFSVLECTYDGGNVHILSQVPPKLELYDYNFNSRSNMQKAHQCDLSYTILVLTDIKTIIYLAYPGTR